LRSFCDKETKKIRFKNKLSTIVRQVKRIGESQPFRKPVDTKSVPGYNEKVKNPIDLTTIEHKIEADETTTLPKLSSDMLLLRNNCFLFNGKDSDLGHLAMSCWRQFLSSVHSLFPDITMAHLVPEDSIDIAGQEMEEKEDPAELLHILERNWKWGFLTMWCETFGKFVFSEDFLFDPLALQTSLTEGKSSYAANLAIILLKIYKGDTKDSMNDFTWERALKNEIDTHLVECGLESLDENPLAAYSFAEFTMEEKLSLLTWLCEWCLSEKNLLRKLVVYDESGQPFRSEPFGNDHEHQYWMYMFDNRADVHLYQERTAPAKKKSTGRKRKDTVIIDVNEVDDYTWKLVATDIASTRKLDNELEKEKIKGKGPRSELEAFRSRLQTGVIEILEAKKKQIELIEKRSRSTGVQLCNIITEKRTRGKKTKSYAEYGEYDTEED